MVLHRYDQLRKIYLAPPPQNELIFLIINHEKSKQVYCEKKSPFRGFLEKICFEKILFYFILVLFYVFRKILSTFKVLITKTLVSKSVVINYP